MRMVYWGSGYYVLDQEAADELTRRVHCHRNFEECYNEDGDCTYVDSVGDDMLSPRDSRQVKVRPHTYVSITGNYDAGYSHHEHNINLDGLRATTENAREAADVFEAYLIERT